MSSRTSILVIALLFLLWAIELGDWVFVVGLVALGFLDEAH